MKIGFVGTGLMGKPMIEKLIENNFMVNVFNRTIEKAKLLKVRNAQIKNSMNELVVDSAIIIFMVTDYVALNELVNSCDKSWNKKIVIQMSTISPNENITLSKYFIDKNASYFEAPVLGSITQVRNKELITLVGADEPLPDEIKEILESFSKKIIHVGKVGKASALKLALNQLIVSELSIFSMSLKYVLANEINVDVFMDVLRNSALYAQTFDKKLPNFLKNDFSNPNFPLKHMLKDLKLITEDFQRAGINSEILKEEEKLLHEGLKNGFAEEDYSALYKCFDLHKR